MLSATGSPGSSSSALEKDLLRSRDHSLVSRSTSKNLYLSNLLQHTETLEFCCQEYLCIRRVWPRGLERGIFCGGRQTPHFLFALSSRRSQDLQIKTYHRNTSADLLRRSQQDHNRCVQRPGTTGWGTNFGGLPTVLWFLPNLLILINSPSSGVHTNKFGFIISWATNIPLWSKPARTWPIPRAVFFA